MEKSCFAAEEYSCQPAEECLREQEGKIGQKKTIEQEKAVGQKGFAEEEEPAEQAGRKMVIGVSSRALFDLTVENEIFESGA